MFALTFANILTQNFYCCKTSKITVFFFFFKFTVSVKHRKTVGHAVALFACTFYLPLEMSLHQYR